MLTAWTAASSRIDLQRNRQTCPPHGRMSCRSRWVRSHRRRCGSTRTTTHKAKATPRALAPRITAPPGQRVKDIKKAWETCVLKAHAHAPAWTRNNSLAEALQGSVQGEGPYVP